jgi:tetratricopeptide (TPR) repeat protein
MAATVATSFAPGEGGGKTAARRPNLDGANASQAKAEELLGVFKQLPRALSLVNEALMVRPKVARFYASRAQIYRALGRNQLAFYDLNAAIRLEPRTYTFVCARGLVLRKMRRYNDALVDISTAIEGDPTSLIFRFYRATVLMRMEDYAAAAAEFTLSMTPLPGEKAPPHTNRARRLRAVCLEKQGAIAEALSDLRRTTVTDSSSPSAWNAIGVLFCELGRYKDALDAFVHASDRAGANPSLQSLFLDNRAWCEFNLGDFKTSFETISMAITVGGEDRTLVDPSLMFHRGAIQLSLKLEAKALPDLLRAAEVCDSIATKELRKEQLDVANAAAAGLESSPQPKSMKRQPSTSTMASKGASTADVSKGYNLIAAELAIALGEDPPPNTYSASLMTSTGQSTGAGGAGAGGGEDDTDSDSFTDAVREVEMCLAEQSRKRGVGGGGGGGGGDSTQKITNSASESSARPAATETGDGEKSEVKDGAESMRSHSTGVASRAMRKQPASRNIGRAAAQAKLRASMSMGGAKKFDVPPWVRERVWPEKSAPYIVPRSRATCALSARIQCFLGLCYEMLGHMDRALEHYRNALNAFPYCVPAQFRSSLVLNALGKCTESDEILTSLLDETESIVEEALVLPPGQFPKRSDDEEYTPSASTKRPSSQGSVATGGLSKPSTAEGGKRGGKSVSIISPQAISTGASANTLALWTPASSLSSIVRLGICAIELIPGGHQAGGAGAAEEESKEPSSEEATEETTETSADAIKTEGDNSHHHLEDSKELEHEIHEQDVHLSPVQLANNKARAKVLLIRGKSRQALGRHTLAVSDLTHAIMLDKTVGETYFIRAISSLHLSKAENAAKDCLRAMRLRFDNANVRDILGKSQAHMGHYVDAVREFSTALTIARNGPETPMILSSRAKAHIALGDSINAISDLSKALLFLNSVLSETTIQKEKQQIQELIPVFLEQRAAAHLFTNDWENGLTDLKTALIEADKGKLSTAFKARILYTIGTSQSNSDKYNEAVVSFTSAIDILDPLTGRKDGKILIKESSSGEDADDEGGDDTSSKQHSSNSGMSAKLAASLATAGASVGSGKTPVLQRNMASPPPPLKMMSESFGKSLSNLGKNKGAIADSVSGGLGKWSRSGKLGAVVSSQATEFEKFGASGLTRTMGAARQRFLDRLRDANRSYPLDLVSLRISSVHERAKALQMLSRHEEAIEDFNDVLDSTPSNSNAYFRRACSYKFVRDFDKAALDFELAKQLTPKYEERALLNLNYVGIADIETVILVAAGEEPNFPIFGVDTGSTLEEALALAKSVTIW